MKHAYTSVNCEGFPFEGRRWRADGRRAYLANLLSSRGKQLQNLRNNNSIKIRTLVPPGNSVVSALKNRSPLDFLWAIDE